MLTSLQESANIYSNELVYFAKMQTFIAVNICWSTVTMKKILRKKGIGVTKMSKQDDISIYIHKTRITRKQTLRSLCVAAPILLLVWHRLFENKIYDVSRVKFWKGIVIPKEGFSKSLMAAPILLFRLWLRSHHGLYSRKGGVMPKEGWVFVRSLSLSHQKKDGRVWPHPSFFWYDTDF